MSADKDDTLRQFADVTGADETRSRFFLESANWQLEVALSSFFEHGGNLDEPAPASGSESRPVVLTDSDMDSPSPPTSPKKKDKKEKYQGFATLNTLRQDSSSDEEEGQAFYAGGSERSGQQIIGPGKSRKDIVTEMFKSVRERGAVVFEDEPSTASRGRGAFSGVGYRLGQTSDDHEKVSTNPQSESTPSSRSVRLRLYREGFTVDDGPLRRYSDPQHAEFLRCIRQGEIPPELSDGGGEVRVSLEDRRMEDCPKNVKQQSFGGQGHLLGSPTPPVVGATVGATLPVAASPLDQAANRRAAQEAIQVDDARDTTTVQFRLADGSRLTGRFNTTHTIADLARYVTLAEPSYQTTAFTLLTSFPSQELKDHSLTLQQAGLLNCTLLTRLK